MSFYRKVIRITAMDSPNVRLGLLQRAAGKEPTGEVIMPGVLTWDEYCHRRLTWDPVRQCVGLDARFYEGAEILLFPPEWLNRANEVAEILRSTKKPRKAKAMGVDPAQGGDSTSICVIDEYGVLELTSCKTPDTNVAYNLIRETIHKWDVPVGNVVLDRGGGTEHAHRLRAAGYKDVRTMGFGEGVSPDPRRGITQFKDKLDTREERYAYVNRRAEVYHTLSLLLDPSLNETGFGIPAEYTRLRHELSVFPKLYDAEDRLYLPPKNKKDADSKVKTLVEMIGHSPDEADSLVLAVYGLVNKPSKNKAGVA